jgi:hypothetical protein
LLGGLKMVDKKFGLFLVALGVLGLSTVSFAHYGQGWERDTETSNFTYEVPEDVAEAMVKVMNYMDGTDYTTEDLEVMWSEGRTFGMMGMMG